ncbi:PDR/VanB family oxidoreductase [Mycolicibacterium sp. YH-1]|uniref:PDR/VanB family oxidoreductase n=1 Tax=Mycolicibacterium sp. YH-1 TaxID=2908837 RepID=UPI001F4C12B9|nr:PDR/VanB family oxidoreductase [Mycolicibacterium sp. YH-1]UNB52198.1 PDR/VanB family oxidoreductase [Mycolicibacterium sp. YH-1]
MDLVAPESGKLLDWQPGAHISVSLPVGRRQYSLCGPSDAEFYRIAVLRSPTSRGGSAYIHDEVRVGAQLQCSAPINRFPLVPAEKYLFIAGGIGITPILAMLVAAEKAGADWRLVYGGRTLATMAFLDELSAYSNRVTVVPQDTEGHIELDTYLGSVQSEMVYSCGPEPLLRAVQERAGAWAAEQLHFERFEAASDLVTTREDDLPFDVFCNKSNVTVPVVAEQTMLNALLEAGLDVDSDCEEGTCGTCEITYLAGTADHRDDLLLDSERATLILPCVSRGRGVITVDL